MFRQQTVAGAALASILLAAISPAQQATQVQGPASSRPAVRVGRDCNRNGINDQLEITSGSSLDCDGNLIPDECDLGRVTLLRESFEQGLGAGWTANGAWHITGECSPIPRCDGMSYAYFGDDSVCNFDFATSTHFGTLEAPEIALPVNTGLIELSYCSAYEGEGMDPYDAADVLVNGVLMDHASPTTQHTWELRTIDLTAFAGQSVTIQFSFDTLDGNFNEFRGWQVDDVRLSYVIGPPGPDCDRNGVPDGCDPDCNLNGLPDECDLSLGMASDCNFNGVPDECDTASGASPDCNLNGIPDECDISISLPVALENLALNYSVMTSFFPDTFEFFGGEVGTCIGPAPTLSIFHCGNRLNTNLETGIDYTNGTAIPSTAFGPGSSYFTAKYPGLFVMAAVNCSIDTFAISGQNFPYGGMLDSWELTVAVDGQLYTIFMKRSFGSTFPSLNQILVVPGDAAGITHSYSPDTTSNEQILDGLAGIDRIFYVFVSRRDEVGLPLRPVDAREIVRELIENLPAPLSADADSSGIPDECE